MDPDQVFRKIKEISMRMRDPHDRVQISEIASELSLDPRQLHPSITELKRLLLLQHDMHVNTPMHVKLTLLGASVMH